jgi:hypothetical protein
MGFTLGSGRVRLTADGAVITSGLPVRVYSVTWLSGTTAGYVGLRNGTGTSADLDFYLDGTASKTKTENFEGGKLFPAGCYCDIDANVSWVSLECVKEA